MQGTVPNAGQVVATAEKSAKQSRAKQQMARAALETSIAAQTSPRLAPGTPGMSREDSISIVKRFVPRMVLETIIQRGPQVRDKPEMSRYLAAVGFFDVSGFSKLAHELEASHNLEANKRSSSSKFELNGFSYKGAGAEELAGKLNSTLSSLISRILKYGGDIIKFAGDAILVVWRVDNENDLPKAVYTAAKCAMLSTAGSRRGSRKFQGYAAKADTPIQGINGSNSHANGSNMGSVEGENGEGAKATDSKKSTDFVLPLNGTQKLLDHGMSSAPPTYHSINTNSTLGRTFSGRTKSSRNSNDGLGLHVGIGCGHVVACHVGGERKRWEFFIAGDSCLQANVAEGDANESEVVLSQQAWSQLARMEESLEQSISVKILPSKNALLMYLPPARIVYEKYENEMDTLMKQMDSEQLKAAQSYVPRTLLEAQGKGGNAVNALRRITVIFFKLSGVEITEVEGENDRNNFIDRAQHQVKMIQESAYKYFATLRQFILDDKGFVAIVVLGLPPFFHQDNASRAVKVAWCLLHEKKVKATAGICTGTVFCGVIGSSQRAEYSVAGDCINLAARLMTIAKPQGALCDRETMEAAKLNQSPFEFTAMPPVAVKGSANEKVEVFETRKVEVSQSLQRRNPKVAGNFAPTRTPSDKFASVVHHPRIWSMGELLQDTNVASQEGAGVLNLRNRQGQGGDQRKCNTDEADANSELSSTNSWKSENSGNSLLPSTSKGNQIKAGPEDSIDSGLTRPPSTRLNSRRPPPLRTEDSGNQMNFVAGHKNEIVNDTKVLNNELAVHNHTSNEQNIDGEDLDANGPLSKLKAAAFLEEEGTHPLRVAFIEGEAGSGKSHLIEELVGSSLAQYVISTSGDSTENRTPFYVWREILLGLLELGDVEDSESGVVNTSPSVSNRKRVLSTRQSEDSLGPVEVPQATEYPNLIGLTGKATPRRLIHGHHRSSSMHLMGRLSMTRSQSHASTLAELPQFRNNTNRTATVQKEVTKDEDSSVVNGELSEPNTVATQPDRTLPPSSPSHADINTSSSNSQHDPSGTKPTAIKSLFQDCVFSGMASSVHEQDDALVDQLSPLTSFEGILPVPQGAIHALRRSRSSTSSLMQSPRAMINKRRVSYAGVPHSTGYPVASSTLRHQVFNASEGKQTTSASRGAGDALQLGNNGIETNNSIATDSNYSLRNKTSKYTQLAVDDNEVLVVASSVTSSGDQILPTTNSQTFGSQSVQQQLPLDNGREKVSNNVGLALEDSDFAWSGPEDDNLSLRSGSPVTIGTSQVQLPEPPTAPADFEERPKVPLPSHPMAEPKQHLAQRISPTNASFVATSSVGSSIGSPTSNAQLRGNGIPGSIAGSLASPIWGFDSRNRRLSARSRADSSTTRFNVTSSAELVFRLGSSQSHDTLSTLNESPILKRLRASGKLHTEQLSSLNRILPSLVAYADADQSLKGGKAGSMLRKSTRRTSGGMASTFTSLAPKKAQSTPVVSEDDVAIELMLLLLEEASKFGTILIVMENAHSMDSDSIKLMQKLLQRDVENHARGETLNFNIRFVVAYRKNWLETEQTIRDHFEKYVKFEDEALGAPSNGNTSSSPKSGISLRSSIGSTSNLQLFSSPKPQATHQRSRSTLDTEWKHSLQEHDVDTGESVLRKPTPSKSPRLSKTEQPKLSGLVHFFEMKPLSMYQCTVLLGNQQNIIVTQELLHFLYKRSKGNPEALLRMYEDLVDGNHVVVDQVTRLVSVVSDLPDLDGDGVFITSHLLAAVHQAFDALSPDAKLLLKLASVVGNRVPKLLLSWLYRKAITQTLDVAGGKKTLARTRTDSLEQSQRGDVTQGQPSELVPRSHVATSMSSANSTQNALSSTLSRHESASVEIEESDNDPLLEPILKDLENSSFFQSVPSEGGTPKLLKFNSEDARCVLYRMMLLQDRKTIHSQIVYWFRTHQWHASLLAGPNHLGLHSYLAGDLGRAFDYFEEAVKLAIRQGRKADCIEHLDQCSEIIDKISQGSTMPKNQARVKKVRYHLLLAQQLINARSWEEASKHLKKVLHYTGRKTVTKPQRVQKTVQRGFLNKLFLLCFSVDKVDPHATVASPKARYQDHQSRNSSGNVGVISIASDVEDIEPAPPAGNALNHLGLDDRYAVELEYLADLAQSLLDSLVDLQQVTRSKIESVMELSDCIMDRTQFDDSEDECTLGTPPLPFREATTTINSVSEFSSQFETQPEPHHNTSNATSTKAKLVRWFKSHWPR